ncbi:hypothetical protein N9V23_04220, partial [Flavobacteriales bacterium]|nr:hypothetical protein [Flavobacteriales bacterium]
GEDSNGNCIEIVVEGCMDQFACNYVEEANTDSQPSLCIYKTEYLDCSGNCYLDEDNDQVCDQLETIGCQEEAACNYDPKSTQAGLCLYPIETYLDCNNDCLSDADADGICDQFDLVACQDELALNYKPFASDVDNDLCEYPSGCMDTDAANYDASAILDDGTCVVEMIGCTNSNYLEYSAVSNINNQELCVTPVVLGCMDSDANNYNPSANINTYQCIYDIVVGCMDPLFIEYNNNASKDTNPSSCENVIVFGCTQPDYLEYDSTANVDNGTCQSLEYPGCLDPDYQEFDTLYTVNNQSDCINPHIYGCTNPLSVGASYNANATIDDGSCILIGCSDSTFAEYYNQGFIPNVADDFGAYNNTFCETPAILGCINSYATNYNSNANVATDECEYEDGDYISFEFNNRTGDNCSIIIPDNEEGDSNDGNVSFTGDFTESFPEGSVIGVFYYDFNGVLRNGIRQLLMIFQLLRMIFKRVIR